MSELTVDRPGTTGNGGADGAEGSLSKPDEIGASTWTAPLDFNCGYVDKTGLGLGGSGGGRS